MKYAYAPCRRGKSWSKYILAAIRMGIPLQIISWRLNNGWPIHLLHATTIDERGMS